MGAVTAHPLFIAIADDEAHMRRALERLLGLHGHHVALFPDGISLLAAHAAQRFDCVVLDLHMPGVGGFEVLERLATNPDPSPVIVITGNDEPGNEARARRLGACAYLLKPVDEAPLLKAIESGTRTSRTPT